MWGEKITQGTLRYIFQHNFQVDQPGGNTWSIKPRKRKPYIRSASKKQYNRVVSFLRMTMSWKFRIQLNKKRMCDRGVLSWFIGYIQRHHDDLFVYNTYEEYEF